MNKLVLLIIGGIVVVGGAALLITRGNDDSSVKVTNTVTGQSQEVKTGSDTLVAVDACDVLTENVAKQILGDGATKEDTSASSVSSAAVSVSSCVYTAKIDPNAKKPNNIKGVSILVRAAKSKSGADSNKTQFGSAKPTGVQDVSDIGDKAFFNPQFRQLNILKGGNWYIASSYSGRPTSGTVESDTQLAELLTFK